MDAANILKPLLARSLNYQLICTCIQYTVNTLLVLASIRKTVEVFWVIPESICSN